MQTLLILTASNPVSNPRPRRMIENLRGHYKLSAMGIGTEEIEGVETYAFSSYQKRSVIQEIRLYFHSLTSQWDKLIWTKNRLEIIPFLQDREFDYIICFDLPLLPIALKYKKSAKVIFDAQEYFPLWLTSSWRWKVLFKRFNHYLCQIYLPQVDEILSVSPSFLNRYKREYGVDSKLYLSLPYFYAITPKPLQKKEFQILYHGSLSSNRSIEEVIRLSDLLQEHLSLNLILVGGEKKYRDKIEEMIKTRQKNGQKIKLLPPVKFEEIIPFGANYDIGLYFMPPKTYNLLCTIPNKFFEYIGSALAVISTPNTDVASMIEQYGVGEVSQGFDIHSMAKVLNSLTLGQINAYKTASSQASKVLNNAQNQKVILEILEGLKSRDREYKINPNNQIYQDKGRFLDMYHDNY